MTLLLRYWLVIEVIVILAIPVFVLWRLERSAKRRRANPRPLPKSLAGRIGFSLLRVLRVVGVGLGTLLAVVLFVAAERVLYTVITDAMPAPSEVSLPAHLPFEMSEVTFEGGDGLQMAGWRIPSQNGVTVILLHGYGGNRSAMLWHAGQLARAGYGVLLYDERASGESEGTYRSFGWEDPRDVQGAIRFIAAGAGAGGERIGIAGCSIGGQIALQSAAFYPELEAVWADGPGIVRGRDLAPPRNPIGAVIYAANYSLDLVFPLKLGIEAPAPMIEIIGDIAPRPIMLVGGGQPFPFVGSEGETVIPRYAYYAGANAQTWVLPEVTHCDGPARRPQEYAARMIQFFDTAFGITRE